MKSKNKNTITRLALFCGSGEIPAIALAEIVQGEVADKNFPLVVYHTEDSTEIAQLAKEYPASQKVEKIRLVRVAKFGEILRFLKQDKVSHILIAGKISKKILMNPLGFDLTALRLIRKMATGNDHDIFSIISKEVEKWGVQILPQTDIFKGMQSQPGVFSRVKPGREQKADIDFGMKYAREISRLDIGQTVVVYRKTILAVEAIEGTDQTIERGGELALRKGAVVCKAQRKNQDTRFDVPVVGMSTIESMKRSGCKVLAVEANAALIVDFPSVLKRINEYKMIFVVV